jgi:hypothetical protein
MAHTASVDYYDLTTYVVRLYWYHAIAGDTGLAIVLSSNMTQYFDS